MASSAPKKDKKPMFGLLVSPAIFARKWNTKFVEHLLDHETTMNSIREIPSGSIPWFTLLIDFGSELLALILHARREAKSIDLDPAVDTVDEALRFVWEKVEISKMTLDELVKKFQDAKNGSSVHGDLNWRDLPLSLRRQINEFVYVISEIKASGKWVIIREQVRQALEISGLGDESTQWVDCLPYE